VRNRQLRADPSQGSHFFQNLTSLGIPYLTVDENNGAAADGKDRIDWQWLLKADPAHDGRWVRHVRLKRALTVTCDGRTSIGMIDNRNGASHQPTPRQA